MATLGSVGRVFVSIYVCFLVLSQVTAQDYFYGAVVEYGVLVHNGTSELNATITQNLDRYESIVEQIKANQSDVKIIVFPEGGLQVATSEDPQLIASEIVPNVTANVIPCDVGLPDFQFQSLLRLSCLAKKHQVYLVANLYEKEIVNASLEHVYNTNVVFSSTGAVIARYRKYHVWGQNGRPITKPEDPDMTFFDTDFGVRFGTFTCFDIIFKTPAVDLVNVHNITHFVFPTGWFSELPFLTAIQEQASWARANNVVLLASNLNAPDVGHTGSGIYVGNTVVMAEQITQKHDFAIIARIPKSVRADWVDSMARTLNVSSGPPGQSSNFKLKSEKQMPLYTSESIADSSSYTKVGPRFWAEFFREGQSYVQNKRVCSGEFCCNFTYSYVSVFKDDLLNISALSDLSNPYQISAAANAGMLPVEDSFRSGLGGSERGDSFGRNEYRLVVFDGVRSYDDVDTGGVQVCAIVSCASQNSESCASSTYDVAPQTRTFSGRQFSKFFSYFGNITITALFSGNNTLIAPNVLVQDVSLLKDVVTYGSVKDARYDFYKDSQPDSTVMASISNGDGIAHVGVFGLYTRLFLRDGQPATTRSGSTPLTYSTILVVLPLVTYLLAV